MNVEHRTSNIERRIKNKAVFGFEHLRFEFWICFEFRASDFEFLIMNLVSCIMYPAEPLP